MGEHGKLAALILGPSEKKEEGPDEYETVASEIIDAKDSKNPKALASALKAFVSLCQGEGSEEETSEEI